MRLAAALLVTLPHHGTGTSPGRVEPKRSAHRVGGGGYPRRLVGGDAVRRLALGLALVGSLAVAGCAAGPGAATPADVEEARARAEALLDQGDLRLAEAQRGRSIEPALRAYQAALDADPLLFQAHLRLAQCYYLTRQVELEEAEYLKALAVNPRSAEAWERLGHARLSQDDLEGARAAYEAVLRLEPGHGVVLYNLGLVEADLGRSARAHELFERARRSAARSTPRSGS